jgi:hypothetical protein
LSSGASIKVSALPKTFYRPCPQWGAQPHRLFAAAKDTGLFYLDLYGTADGGLTLEDVDEMFNLAEKLHDID